MKLRHLLLLLLVPALLACSKDNDENSDNNDNQEVNTPEEQEELPTEVKDGDIVLSTNAVVEKFLNDVHYPNHDYSYTSLLTWAEANDVNVCPGKWDKPQTYSIRWKEVSGDVTVKLWEGSWSREQTVSEVNYLAITNLRPNADYHFEVKDASGNILNQGAFKTTGHVHQLFFKNYIRNCRDLGGWKTESGKTVKYRMVYRGGRLDPNMVSKAGAKDIAAEGIKAQLDLRGKSDVLSKSTLGDDPEEYPFCAPVIEEGYSTLLKNDKDRARQCMQFIMDCVDRNKPVYFHCSLGRDRTGTIAMLTLGVLGVPEGDISQEYELTQFSVSGFATSSGETTKMTRLADYDSAANVIWTYVDESKGETFADGVEKYLIEIGISKADIDKFRSNMLQ